MNIENNSGVVISIQKEAFDAYVEDDSLDKHITSILKAVKNDEGRTGLELITTSEQEIGRISISKDEIAVIAQPTDLTKLTDRFVEETTKQRIRVGKVDFSGKTMWKIFIANNEENATIEDDDFLENIDQYKFGTRP